VSAPLQHQTVLLREAVEALKIQSAGSYIDGTFGRGGHSLAILERLGPAGRLLAIDRDPQAVAAASVIDDKRLLVRHQRFGDLLEALRQGGFPVDEGVDGVLLDIGVSSPQLDQGERGFSFRQPRGSSPRLYARPCAPVSPARMRRRVPFKLYGFISIKSSSNSR